MSTLGISDPTILEGVESLYDIYESGFGRLSTLVSIPLFGKRFQLSMRTKLLSMMLLKFFMREEYVLVGVAIMSSFLSTCLKFCSYTCFAFLC